MSDNERLIELFEEYIFDPQNVEKNYQLALHYEKMGQTAAAITFFIRAAERTEHDEIAYSCLVRTGYCFDRQGDRFITVMNQLRRAIGVMPNRPEAYYEAIRILNWFKEWSEAYMMAEICSKMVDFDLPEKEPLTIPLEYPGEWGFLYEKARCGWMNGMNIETRELYKEIMDNYWDDVDGFHKNKILFNAIDMGCRFDVTWL